MALFVPDFIGFNPNLHLKLFIMNRLFMFVAFAALFLAACVNPQKLVYQGRYDEAIQHITRKFKSSLKRSPENVTALEDALAKANDADSREIGNLKAQNQDSNWENIKTIYRRIKTRQELIRPLLPVKDDNGRVATLNLMEVEQAINESGVKALEFNYNRAVGLLAANDVLKAREAYVILQGIEKDYPGHKDVSTLIVQARTKGTINILLTYEDKTNLKNDYSQTAFVDSLFKDFVADEWNKYDREAKPNVLYDYTVFVKVNFINFSAFFNNPNTLQRTAEVDTTVNNVAQKKTVTATLNQNLQSQQIDYEYFWQVSNNRTNETVCLHQETQNPLNYKYERTTATFTGDKRALTTADKKQVDDAAKAFPNKAELMRLLSGQVRRNATAKCAWRKP